MELVSLVYFIENVVFKTVLGNTYDFMNVLNASN
jgi:hypothetical protein